MKKMFSLALALIMALALCVPAMAEEETPAPGSITLENALETQTYTAYKVFDVTYNAGKTTYAYSISGDSEWFDTVSAYTAGIKLTKAASENTYKVEATNAFSAAEFANLLKADTSKSDPIVMDKAEGKASVEGLDLGYYFVESATGALCNLTTTQPAATIYDKNDIPFEKVDNKDTVEVGEVVNYTITGKVPDTTGFETYTYEIADTMSAGLTFNKDVSVKVGGEALAGDHYTLTTTDTGFTLAIDVMEIQAQVTEEIKVEYTATVNENAVAQVETNSATLKYSDDPTHGESFGNTPPDVEKVYSAKIVIDKYEKGDTSKKLPNASFKLYKEDGENNKLFYKFNAEKKDVEWVAEEAADVKVTDANGAASFDGLADGTYYLLETAAPDGYNLLAEPVTVTIDGKDATVENEASLTVNQPVANATGSLLPSTGGIGTTIFYTIGGLLMAGAAILLVTKKKLANEQ